MAVKTTPVISLTGPVGRWLPGIHLGVVRVTGPGCDGDVDFGVVELARRFGEVGGDADGGLLGLEESRGAEQEEGEEEGAAVRQDGHEREVPLGVRMRILILQSIRIGEGWGRRLLSGSLRPDESGLEGGFDGGDDGGVVGRDFRGEAGDYVAVAVDEELFEVPEDAGLGVGGGAVVLARGSC